MADDSPIDVAQIVALFLESLFYGLYLVSFGMCMYTMLVKSGSRQGRHNIFIIVALLLFVFATLDVALLLRHVLDAFVWYKGSGGPIAEFSEVSYWVNVMKTVTYAAQTSIGDGMLVYRCYVVCAGSWLIAGPLCVLWVAGIIVSAFWCYIEFTLHTNTFLNAGELKPFITSTLSITLALNLVATCISGLSMFVCQLVVLTCGCFLALIVYKIGTVERRSRTAFAGTALSDTSALRRNMHIVIESGLMYSASVVVFFVVYLASNNAQYGVSDCVVQIIGIAFNLIIVRIDQGKAVETTFASERSRMESRSRPSKRSLHFRLSRQTGTCSSTIGADEGDNGERDPAIAMMSFSSHHGLGPEETGECVKDPGPEP